MFRVLFGAAVAFGTKEDDYKESLKLKVQSLMF